MNTIEPPPILTDIEDDLKKYLLNPESLPIHQYERNQEFWPRTADPLELLNYEDSPISSMLKVQRDINTGEIIGLKEVVLEDAGATARNSMSLNREPAPPNDAIRGSTAYLPFWPGSFPKPETKLPEISVDDSHFLTVPPGFSRGLLFNEDGRTLSNQDQIDNKIEKSTTDTKKIVNLLDLVHQQQDLLGVFNETNNEQQEELTTSNQEQIINLPEENDILQELNTAPVLAISKTSTGVVKRTEWAVLLDCSKPVQNFNEKIPDLAFDFPFELDTFQKLAILELEKHNHVFVAAPTSAGKTVVAQYAIALSQKHRTKTIYTSPIKALSNQKYRDFKKVFEDVGLITGDFQVNQKASCLVMTTEILRSMLYCGSEITKDLEYVIFDEVHYVNDPERGHVWEQVMILLPANVCVVLLSATVPNAIEFADWLGQTHKRTVYVVSTDDRPVPLHHYLYVGIRGDVKQQRKLILQKGNKWYTDSYREAKSCLTNQKTNSKLYGPMYLNWVEEKRFWTGLISHLKKEELLPAVAFIFSRNRCNKIAYELPADFTDINEKKQIDEIFGKCITCLKQADQNIPQVRNMRKLLAKGIGVHHSGILPILKEIVELLFQEGRIKLLFATETFAMGVNMPARTVIFDSVKKHDGKELRDLVPAEYIQMAGRAGRRSHDTQGTILILCKTEIPHESTLCEMILGKPSFLKSKFRLTYGMVLSLLRVESLSVEGMMARSFLEVNHQKNVVKVHDDIKELERQLSELNKEQQSNYLQPLVEFFYKANDYLEMRNVLMIKLVVKPKFAKILTPGRILLITHQNHMNKLALLLKIHRTQNLNYQVLVLTDSTEMINKNEAKENFWYKMLSLANDSVYVPQNSAPSHQVLRIYPEDVMEVTDMCLKVKTDLVYSDWEKRQQERFRNDPPGKSCSEALNELYNLSIDVNAGRKEKKLHYLHFIYDINLNDQDTYDNLVEYYTLKEKVMDHLVSTRIPNLEYHLGFVFERKYLEKLLEQKRYSVSNESLSLYSDLKNKINLLQHLGYVNANKTIELKGKVACEMGMSEILITELVLRNIFKKLRPAEVAAILSPLVFTRSRSRNNDTKLDDSDLTKNLQDAVKEVDNLYLELSNMEQSHDIEMYEFQEELNFEIVRVVYEWASGMSFANIMTLTDIQEGIIVRCIQQLNETICDVKKAARIIGDSELQDKMEQASTAVKRDIVFAASLYTTAT